MKKLIVRLFYRFAPFKSKRGFWYISYRRPFSPRWNIIGDRHLSKTICEERIAELRKDGAFLFDA